VKLAAERHQKPAKPSGSAGHAGCAEGEAQGVPVRGESAAARDDQTSWEPGELLGQVLAKENMAAAWKRVKANKGSCGVDGLSIEQTAEHLKTQWPAIRQGITDGTYRPQPVRRVAIPKPGGGQRELGIPTVTDRLIQQALLQVLQRLIDPTFSEHSHGFRPGRSAHGAILEAQRYVEQGCTVVVDVDLEKFFDRVNHDILMARLARRIADKAVLGLIRRYLQAGIMDGGLHRERHEGTPQGGPLSPLLANVLLDDVDRELERRGHRFVRYADDCNVYVRSMKAGQRVLKALRRCYARLRLRINEAKTAVAPVDGRKFLGYCFRLFNNGRVYRDAADTSVRRFRQRVGQVTARTRGRSMDEMAQALRDFVPGWRAYFRLVQLPSTLRALGTWMRHRLRAVQLKQWRRGVTVYRELRALGAGADVAARVAGNVRRWWRNSRLLVNTVLTNQHFAQLGFPSL
jgi:RNA-directed DNA polymerase